MQHQPMLLLNLIPSIACSCCVTRFIGTCGGWWTLSRYHLCDSRPNQTPHTRENSWACNRTMRYNTTTFSFVFPERSLFPEITLEVPFLHGRCLPPTAFDYFPAVYFCTSPAPHRVFVYCSLHLFSLRSHTRRPSHPIPTDSLLSFLAQLVLLTHRGQLSGSQSRLHIPVKLLGREYTAVLSGPWSQSNAVRLADTVQGLPKEVSTRIVRPPKNTSRHRKL